MIQFVINHKWRFIGSILGFVAGYLYWFYIGCSSGSCPIQSTWYTSSLYGALLGYLFSDLKKKSSPKKEHNDE